MRGFAADKIKAGKRCQRRGGAGRICYRQPNNRWPLAWAGTALAINYFPRGVAPLCRNIPDFWPISNFRVFGKHRMWKGTAKMGKSAGPKCGQPYHGPGRAGGRLFPGRSIRRCAKPLRALWTAFHC